MTVPGRMMALAVLLTALSMFGHAGEAELWRPFCTVRFGNVDAIDTDDGDLAAFVREIRNDGRFPYPLRTLIGPEIRNPTFFGLVYEAWLEYVAFVPVRPGELAGVWVFPVEDRDEYLTQLASLGLSEYEGMDGVTVLREMDPDGNTNTWYLEWLPGNIAVFGADRTAVAAGRTLYNESGGYRGLLAGAEGRYIEPDVMVVLEPARLAGWQPLEPGAYWWRDEVGKMTSDLLGYWLPGVARRRLIEAMAEAVATLPLALGPVRFSCWFEQVGVEWRVELTGELPPPPPMSDLPVLRRIPENAALAYGQALAPDSLARLGVFAGNLFLGSAGGVVTTEARDSALLLYTLLAAAGPDQLGVSLITPPVSRPELGASGLLVVRWSDPGVLSTAWTALTEALRPNTPVSNALGQMGWDVKLEPVADSPETVEVTILPVSRPEAEPYFRAVYVCRQMDGWTAIAGGRSRVDAGERGRVAAYRAGLAEQAVASPGEGSPDARLAFTLPGSGGAAFLAWLDPVRAAQMALVETADWRPRSPDQAEPVSTRYAREMLEYSPGGAWGVAGQAGGGTWRVNGVLPWRSLIGLSAALGITEATAAQ